MPNEDARELLSASPGSREPRDYVKATRGEDGTLIVIASYTPIGYGMARHASWQYMDAVARKALPGCTIDTQGMSGEGGTFRLGFYVRRYVMRGNK